MVKSKYFIFGYREIFVGDRAGEFVARLIKAKIPFEAICAERILILEGDFQRFQRLFRNESYTTSELLGIRGLPRKIKHRAAFYISSLVGVLLVILSSLLVWDVRISGNETVPDALILERLEECGFSVGSIWNNLAFSDIEYDMLEKCEEISWINVNRVGTVAFVKVIESRESAGEGSVPTGYANIVADRDCVIEEITVKRGTPVVKVGDTVRKGDLLIMGVENNELGRLTYAEGSIVGRAYDTLSTSVGRERSVRYKKSENISSVTIKIFDFSLNIFKKYGNLDNECDIIESKRRITLFGKYRLPIEIETKSEVFYETVTDKLSDAELISVCSVRHRQMLKSRLMDRDLGKITTSGSISDDGYVLTSDIVYSAEVGAVSEIKVE